MRKLFPIILIVFCFSVFHNLSAQQLATGSIKGKITDPDGVPLPGVSITVTSPSLIGSVTGVTNADGDFRAPGLPPGRYKVMAELDGFKTVIREGVIVHVGMVIAIDLLMEPSPLQEQVTVIAPSPVVDTQSTKLSTTVTTDVLANLPVSRDFSLLVNAMPGVLPKRSGLVRAHSSIHGGGAVSHIVDVDGVTVNDPAMHEMFTDIQYDSVEEIEITGGGLPAQVGHTSGSFINIVTKSGGNDFHGMFQTFLTTEDMVGIPIPDYEIKALGVSKPQAPIIDLKTSGNFGGPIIRDKLWFYSSLEYKKSKENGQFAPTVILGKQYDTYDFSIRQWEGFFKLTSQISPSMRFFAMFSLVDRNLPYTGTYTTRTAEAVQSYIFHRYTGTGNLSWHLGTNTMLDAKVGLSILDFPIPMQEGVENNPRYIDGFTGYQWGSAYRTEYVYRRTTQASAQLTHFIDNFIGGDHEFKAGLQYRTGMDRWDSWKGGNQISEWSYYNGNPYYYRGLYGLDGPHPVYGDGRLSFLPCGSEKGSSYVQGNGINFGAFIQDSWTIKDRLSLNLGVRFDVFSGSVPKITKTSSSDLPRLIGEYYFAPEYGINPFDTIVTNEWKNPLGRPTSISPRIGLSYDLFGNDKTALKASYSIYHEEILVSFFENVSPFYLRAVTYDWWDLNNNGAPDAPPEDKYNPHPSSVIQFSESYYKQKIYKDIDPPRWQELIFGIQHELVEDFNIGLQYIDKTLTNELSSLLFDVDNQRFLYTYELASEYWVPFTTTVPALGTFPEKKLTLYYPKNNHPDWFSVLANVPDAKMRYQAFELTFNKRMSRGWQLGGSVVLSKAKGTIGDNRYAFSYGEITPNYWVNRDGKKALDRPLMIKIYGTFSLPLDFLASFYYLYDSSSPFGRTVTVYPPEEWASANNVRNVGYNVYVEPVGFGRDPSYSTLDIRLEKKFNLGKYGELGIFMDLLNALSHRNVFVGTDPGGTWTPVAENTNVGTYTPSYWFGRPNGIEGARILQVSIRYSF